MTKVVDLDKSWKNVVEIGFSGLIQNTGSRDLIIFIGEPDSERGHKLPSNEFMRFEKTSRRIYAKASSTIGEIAITADDTDDEQ